MLSLTTAVVDCSPRAFTRRNLAVPWDIRLASLSQSAAVTANCRLCMEMDGLPSPSWACCCCCFPQAFLLWPVHIQIAAVVTRSQAFSRAARPDIASLLL